MPTREFLPIDAQARQAAATAVSAASAAVSTADAARTTAGGVTDRVTKLERVRRVRVNLPAVPSNSSSEVLASWSSSVLPAGTIVVNVTLEVPNTPSVALTANVKAGTVSASGCTLIVRNSGTGALPAMAGAAHITAASV
jgi:hypothetical protein